MGLCLAWAGLERAVKESSAIVSLLASLAIASAVANPQPVDLTVGPLLSNPLGYSERQLQFSWKLPAGECLRQSAYRIVAASAIEHLPEKPDVWDSGWVDSAQSVFVDYDGKALESRDRVFWRVCIKDEEGREGAWSDPAWFEMSLLDGSDWIFLPEEQPEESPPAPYLRKEFELGRKAIRSSRMYTSAKGMFEVELNGERVWDEYFAPEWTDYNKRIHSTTHDVTSLLHSGANAVGAILGETWYTGWMGFFQRKNSWGLVPEFLMQLEVTYEDGSREVVVSDSSWHGARGPVVCSNIYMGEDYDARLELGAWSRIGYDASSWKPVESKPVDPVVRLEPKPNQPVRATQELRPKAVTKLDSGRWVFDLGQNMVGLARIRVPGESGRTYTIRFAEMLQKDGSLYTENYRDAKSTDTYTCRGDEWEVWQPRFTFHGFRYVELSGVPADRVPDSEWVTGIMLHNAMPPTGSFASSDSMLNQLQSNIQWSQRGNFLAVPTDCPQRNERLGWTGDAQVFCGTANFNFNTLAFFAKWCADLRDSQYEDGGIPYFAPTFPAFEKSSSSAWGDAAVIVPWMVYQSFGYKRILEENLQMMSDWLRFYQNSPDTHSYIYRGFSYGDWCQPYANRDHGNFGDTDKSLIGTAYFARCADLVSRAADVLGRRAEGRLHRELLQRIKGAFQETFFDAEGRLITKFETQTGYLLALAFDLLEESMREKAVAHLVRLIQDEAGGHLRTGFLGTPLICPVLTRFGHADLAYEILFKTTYPGWFFSIEQGATTMWERWNSYTKADGFGPVGMNSFNHYAYGAIGEWIYGSVAGLRAAQPGYREIEFRPRPGRQLQPAEAVLDTPYGTARSAWRRRGGNYLLELQVPPNTTGNLVWPDRDPMPLGPGVHSFVVDGDGSHQNEVSESRSEDLIGQTQSPNIILIVADDLGARDLGCHGSDLHETPNLDAMARDGIEFTRAYAAAPVCSPTRASILTGKNPARLRMTTWHEDSLPGPGRNRPMIPALSEANLPLEETTIAEVLQAAGYRTFHVGKWHLGEASYFPENQGFEVNIAGHHWGCPPTFFAPYQGVIFGERRYIPDLHAAEKGEYLADRLTTEALHLMAGAGSRPFFLSLNYYAPHVPVEGKPELTSHYAAKVSGASRHRNPGYAAMVQSLDEGVGRVLAWLDDTGKRDHTIIVFISDNGGFDQEWNGRRVTTNHPLRSGKGSLYEGGIRIPWLMLVPGPKKPGKVDIPVTTCDLLPTLLDLVGLQGPDGDGISLKSVIEDPASGGPFERELIFHFPHYYYGTTPVSAIMQGNLKLLQYYMPTGLRFELFDLREDPGESIDLAGERGAEALRLSGALTGRLREMGAAFPRINHDLVQSGR